MNSIPKSVLASLEYSTDGKTWLQGKGERFIRKLGIKEDQSILDFGCRIGHYVIPSAVVVGPTGRVYALDKDHDSLDFLIENAKKLDLINRIIPIKTTGELNISLENDCIDTVLLYDIIHIIIGIDGTLKPLQLLLTELSRILKSGGLLSVFISANHLSKINYTKQDIIDEINKIFTYRNMFKEEMMHWDWLMEGQVENFNL
ncbi:MAG: methyltransferase domain-containing protein [Promethearchaeota archaeon]